MKKSILFAVTLLLLAGCHKPENPEPRCNTKIADWLYGVEYEDYDFAALVDLMSELYEPETAACSEVRKGNFVGRNFDWFINDQASAIIKIDAKDPAHASDLEYVNTARYASIAVVGNCALFTKDVAESGRWNDAYTLLPIYVMDGINEKGLYVGINVAPTGETSFDPSKWESYAWGLGAAYTNPSSPYKYGDGLLNRFLLDHAASVDEAVELIKKVNWYDLVGIEIPDAAQSFIWMISDAKKNCVMEFIENTPVFLITENVAEASTSTVMTNFSNAIYKEGIIQDSGSGYERFQTALDYYPSTPATVDGMRSMMKRLWYSQVYTTKQKTPGFRYSDIIPDGVSMRDFFNDPSLKDNQDIVDYIDIAQQQFVSREDWHSPDNLLWYTTHTSVYDLEAKTLSVFLHEGLDGDTRWYDFSQSASFAKPFAGR